jgi:acyl-lipid Delta6-acetylenase / acyl-lipid (9-3)-desaturase
MKQKITLDEVKKHKAVDSLWIILNNNVYDVTRMVASGTHPGGLDPLLLVAGNDATDAFNNYHPAYVQKRLAAYCIGELEPCDRTIDSALLHDYRDLQAAFESEGLHEINHWYFAKLYLWCAALLVLALGLTLLGSSTAVRLAGAATLGLFIQQILFLAHDAGHSGVTHQLVVDRWLGLLFGPLLTGISMVWWKHDHNMHHFATNSIQHDCHFCAMPVLAADTGMFRWFLSSLKAGQALQMISKWLVGHQDLTFFPVMFLVGRINLHLKGIFYVLGLICQRCKAEGMSFLLRVEGRHCVLDFAGCFVYFAWFSFLVSTLPCAWEQVLYVGIVHAVAGIIHLQICINHYPMPVFHGVPQEMVAGSVRKSWPSMHLSRTTNVECPTWMDWFHGGLHLQIEHHLWPRIPRHNLRAIQPRTIAFCKAHGIPYNSLPFFPAIWFLYDHMVKVAEEVQKLPSDQIPSIWDSITYKAACLEG